MTDDESLSNSHSRENSIERESPPRLNDAKKAYSPASIGDENKKEYIADKISDKSSQIYKPLKAIEVRLACLVKSESEEPSQAKLDLEELNRLKSRIDELFETHFQDEFIPLQEEYDEKYRSLRNKYVSFLAPKRSRETMPFTDDEDPPLKLPTLSVPTFSGEIEKWASFKAMFLNVIGHPRVRNKEAIKAQLLHQALEKDAKDMVENLREASFQDAWDVLVNHYDDPLRRAKTHYEKLVKVGENASNLRQRLVGYRQHTSGLKLACSELKIDPFEFAMISMFLDDSRTHGTVRHNWERRVTEKPADCNLKEFTKYLEREATSSERAFREGGRRPKAVSNPRQRPINRSNRPNQGVALVQQQDVQKSQPKPKPVKFPCPKCSGQHYLNSCAEFKAMEYNDRVNFVSRSHLCNVCFNASCKGATAAVQCPMKQLHCYRCKGLHHSLLHRHQGNNNSGNGKMNCFSDKLNRYCLFNEQVVHSKNFEPLLATALVEVNHNLRLEQCRALLDSGSQFNFISKGLVDRLRLPINKVNVTVSGLQNKTSEINHGVDIIISSRYQSYVRKISCLIVDNIVGSEIPGNYMEISSWKIPSQLHLADPYFHVPGDIEILIGLDLFWCTLKNRTYSLGANLPRLRETEFGWIVAGSVKTSESTVGTSVFFVQLSNNELLEQMKKFWIIEHHNLEFPRSSDELACEAIFEKSTYRQDDGRFVVSLPFKKDPNLLGDSRFDALKQFIHLENRFQRNPQMRNKYVDCMNEYIDLGHMIEISEGKEKSNLDQSYYMPHHPVINPSSTSTSQRTVFNASMKTTSGLSLNEILHVGADDVQPELISTLMRFRIPLYVVTADIVKMFRQIRMHPSHTQYQRVFWRNSPDEKLKVYELTTLSFGERPAPYLAKRCLKELAVRYGENYSNAVPVILNDFFVDNMFTGANSVESLIATLKEIIILLISAGLPLSKWASNDQRVLSIIDPKEIESCSRIGFDDKDMVKALGMYWVPSDDTLRIWFDRPNVIETRTKRQILSVIASIFDPMGLVGPITVRAKCFMQLIWRVTVENVGSTSASEPQSLSKSSKKAQVPAKKRNIHWDEEVPSEILREWRVFAAQLNLLNQISIPRHVTLPDPSATFELHGFADASTRAYGAVLYLRTITYSEVRVHLLCSKSRVAPLKQLSVARLELLAANLLAEMTQKVSAMLTMKISISCIRLWSDSKIALSWIGSQSYKWSVFVAHRVSAIQTLTKNCHWDHVETSSNPADVLSRGSDPKDLIEKQQEWFFGPSWLRNTKDPWTDTVNYFPDPNTTEERKVIRGATLVAAQFKSNIFEKVGLPDTGTNSTKLVYNRGYNKLLRIVAYAARIRRNRSPYFPRPNRIDGRILQVHDIEYAKMILVKLSQAETFRAEINSINNNKPIDKDSLIRNLKPFLDVDGILRVGGRLDNADMSFDQRHPALLSPTHRLTTLIVMHEHLTNLHAGPKYLKSVLRRQYWIVHANSCIARCLKRCHTCVKMSARTQNEVMANLPESRVRPSKPFTHTGVDYAGPFQLIQAGGRCRTKIKVYLAIFVCFASKAIHIEVVYDLTTEKFLEALTRFISRRGMPTHIYSDNGTTFVGAKRKINEMYSLVEKDASKITKFATDKGIQWHFIPPRAPHFGGIWEAGVKSVKGHLYKTIDSYTLKLDQFSTLVAQIEACLNSRPLTPESAEPSDLNALTPGHFLIGGPITSLPGIDYTTIPNNRLKHWEQVTKMTQLFWKRWTTEYLHTLQQRYKWVDGKDPLSENDFVIVKEDNVRPMQWTYGRVKKVYLGDDGKVRVVDLQTSNGILKRPIIKIIKMPIET